MTTRAELSEWFDGGVKGGNAYMVVWCDTFDYEDYPKYHQTRELAQEDLNKTGQNMQKVMEVYDLRKPKAEQLAQDRTWALRPDRG